MAVKTKEELISSVTTIFGESLDDDRISFLDDLADSFDNVSANSNADEIEKLKKEKEELDESWRRRYVERFTSAPIEETKKKEEIVKTEETVGFNDLFK